MATEQRLFDGNALITYFEEQCGIAAKDTDKVASYVLAMLKCCIDFFKNFPTVDAVEVVHGRLGPSYIDEYYGEWKDCLECGADNILPCNYCRICGAKMDGKKE